MNEYSMGALEALSWVVLVLQEAKGLEEAVSKVEDVANKVRGGVAVNFRDRVDRLPSGV